MKQTKVLGVAVLLVGLLAVGCKPQSDSSSTSTSTTDTTKIMTVDSNAMNITKDTMSAKGMMKDSGAMASSPTDTAATKNNSMKGMAKPNVAKKGKKGKTNITMPKMSGEMKPDASGIYSNVDYIPAFPGGNKGLQKFFDDNLVYPAQATDDGVEGTVKVSFTIDENGKIISPIIDGTNEGYGLDDEALRVVKKMPSWTPGKIKGKPVKTKFTLPVRFELN